VRQKSNRASRRAEPLQSASGIMSVAMLQRQMHDAAMTRFIGNQIEQRVIDSIESIDDS